MPTLRRTECPLFDLPRNFLRYAVPVAVDRQRELARMIQALPENSRERSELRNELAAGFYGAVVKVAKRYAGGKFDVDDLIQAGCLGLLRAAERFDPDRGVKFLTLVYVYVGNACRNEIAEMTGNMGSRRYHELRQKAYALEGRYYATFGKWPTDEELADMIGESVTSLRAARRDGATSSIEPSSVLKWHSGEPMDRPEDDDAVFRAIARLTDAEKVVVSRRYGFDGRAETCPEIAATLGVTRQAVSLREQRALTKLRYFLQTS